MNRFDGGVRGVDGFKWEGGGDYGFEFGMMGLNEVVGVVNVWVLKVRGGGGLGFEERKGGRIGGGFMGVDEWGDVGVVEVVEDFREKGVWRFGVRRGGEIKMESGGGGVEGGVEIGGGGIEVEVGLMDVGGGKMGRVRGVGGEGFLDLRGIRVKGGVNGGVMEIEWGLREDVVEVRVSDGVFGVGG